MSLGWQIDGALNVNINELSIMAHQGMNGKAFLGRSSFARTKLVCTEIMQIKGRKGSAQSEIVVFGDYQFFTKVVHDSSEVSSRSDISLTDSC